MKTNNQNFLLIDDSEDALEVLELFIEGEFDNKLVTATSGNEAIEILKKDPHFAIVISDYNMPDGNGEDVYKYMMENKINSPFLLLCGEDVNEMKKLETFSPLVEKNTDSFLGKPFKRKVVIDAIKMNLSFWNTPGEQKEPAIKEIIDYRRINIDKFFKFNIGNKDVFIRLGADKFIKIIEEKEQKENTIEILEKYARKGVKHLYLKKEDYEKFLFSINDTLLSALTVPSKNINDTLNAQHNAIENLHESLLNLRISPDSIKLADAAVESTIKALKKSPNLSILMNQMIQNKNYVYDLAMLNSYMATAIARETEWAKETSYQKLSLAALIQDISLENPNLAKIESTDSSEYNNLSPEEKDMIFEHPIRSVSLLEETEQFSGDSRTIILEHQELPDGNGFPKKLTAQKISPLSCIMIISGYFSRNILLHGSTKENIEKIKTTINEKYNKGNFKKPCQAFLKVMEKYSTD